MARKKKRDGSELLESTLEAIETFEKIPLKELGQYKGFDVLLEKYLEKRGVKKARTRKLTIVTYSIGVNRWLKFCKEEGLPLLEAVEADGDDFIVQLQKGKKVAGRWLDEPVKNSSIGTYLSGIKTLYDALVFCGALTFNPLTKLTAPPKENDRKPELTLEQYLRVLLKLTEDVDDLSVRNLAMIALMGDAGCRVGDVVKLNLEHVDLKNKHLDLYDRKGGVDKLQHPMTEFLVKALRDWLKVRSTYADEGERALFVNFGDHIDRDYIGKRVSKATIQRVGEKAYRAADVPLTSSGVHLLRGRYAQDLYDMTNDLYLVMEGTGHQSIEVLAKKYLRPNQEKLKESVEDISAYRAKKDKKSVLVDKGQLSRVRELLESASIYFKDDLKREIEALLEELPK
jgi:integrase/recombinase XerC